MAVASELRTGTVVRWRGAACQVLAMRANGGVVRALLTDLSTGRSWRQRFPEELQLEELAIEKRAVTYLYERADQNWFMDAQTFEQISLPAELVGKRRPFLDEGMTLWVKFIDGRPISITFDKVVEARIVSTFPPGDYQSAYKRAIIENGTEVTVPLFIQSGDTVLLHVDLLRSISPRKPGDR